MRVVLSFLSVLLVTPASFAAPAVVKIERTESLMPVSDPGISGEVLPAPVYPKPVQPLVRSAAPTPQVSLEGVQVAMLSQPKALGADIGHKLDQLIAKKQQVVDEISSETLASLSYTPNLKPFDATAEQQARRGYVHAKEITGQLAHMQPAPETKSVISGGTVLFDGTTTRIYANSAAADQERMNLQIRDKTSSFDAPLSFIID